MIKIFEDSIIYVVCPHGNSSGGAETLHQLVSELRNDGYKAYIYYHLAKNKKNIEIPNKFKEYDVEYVINIIDNDKNVMIIPESYTELIYKYKKIRKCIWFLSVDFYFYNLNKNLTCEILKKRNIPITVQPFIKPFLYLYLALRRKSFRELHFDKDKNINSYFYLYNCQYAKDFLINNGIKEANTFYLCGPIRDDYIKTARDECVKEDIVVYNPAKGYQYTKKIIEKLSKVNSKIKVIAIKNMTPVDIKKLLKKAKVYIDFGFFPGPERIPREAVCCYCNIITSTLGSAKNDIDVLVPREFKFNVSDDNIQKIVETIILLINKYDENVYKFNEYRKKVSYQKHLFENNVLEIFDRNFKIQ
ncbi:hypothetical protein [Clostridium beijerinckii]|uniref:Glycosyltransferase n=1 Tax=Clostridium beijerinckii TaxID=1520 RepID=A0AAX0B3Q6_CLOBE|nr:hypothetical protein [Clostridium beijerinckii]MBA8936677.1 hypothetical protein [Clostridium beijerinckii]NRT89268.1 hypothetical protein [Clostridium beijerinckii]NRU40855.1 hypothetical protein [Clostridium beijerinckii]NSA95870.1 hypothetical protein [Clostridium beijerinckii]OOM62425.1 hypothetical protein CLOBI_22240 [Clostridium beijerinckii]